jgi:hypothetical protein
VVVEHSAYDLCQMFSSANIISYTIIHDLAGPLRRGPLLADDALVIAQCERTSQAQAFRFVQPAALRGDLT